MQRDESARTLPAITVKPIDKVKVVKFHCPVREWATMSDADKRDAYTELITRAIGGAIRDHPNLLYTFDVSEELPDPKDLLSTDKEPEVIGTVHVMFYEPLQEGGFSVAH